MTRSIPPRTMRPRTMRNVWDEEKRRKHSMPYGTMMRDWHDKNSIRQKYANQIGSNKTSGTSGALYKKGGLEFRSVQGQPRNIYERAGHQGTIYPKKPKSNVSKIKDALNIPSLDEAIKDIKLEIFETGEKISVIAELCFEKIADVFYDAAKEGIVVHADKDYNIPLKLKEGNIKALEWSYNNGIMEITFKKDRGNKK